MLLADKSTPLTLKPALFKNTECLPLPQAKSTIVLPLGIFKEETILFKNSSASVKSRFLYKI